MQACLHSLIAPALPVLLEYRGDCTDEGDSDLL